MPLLPPHAGAAFTARLRRWVLQPWLVWLWAALAVVLVVWVWHLEERAAVRQEHQRLDFEAEEIALALAQRLRIYEIALRGGRGLLDASRGVSRAEWRRYVDNLRLESTHPGVQGLAFAPVLRPSQLAQHERQVRAEGLAQYAVHPPGPRDTMVPIVYIEPLEGRNQRAVGFDMFSEPLRREAMERARDTGLPAMTGRVVLLQETLNDPQHGFLIYLPVYHHGLPTETLEQRRAALRGFVFSPFRWKDFMQGTLAGMKQPSRLELLLSDVATQDLLFSTAACVHAQVERDCSPARLAGFARAVAAAFCRANAVLRGHAAGAPQRWTLGMGGEPWQGHHLAGTRPAAADVWHFFGRYSLGAYARKAGT